MGLPVSFLMHKRGFDELTIPRDFGEKLKTTVTDLLKASGHTAISAALVESPGSAMDRVRLETPISLGSARDLARTLLGPFFSPVTLVDDLEGTIVENRIISNRYNEEEPQAASDQPPLTNDRHGYADEKGL